MNRYICVHGHFYQPPRENPWLESVELQDSAYPHHDWNERVARECYAPNSAARIMDGDGRILRIVNNYSRMSFNFGPTLLHWMETAMPETYRAILEGDRVSIDRFDGHGSALAQVYNHMILPLANRRDKETQILWGLRDFAHRFGRTAEGIWLAETAVDLETLDLLAAHGVRFTILAPRQARRFRRRGARGWRDASEGRIDPSRAYLQRLPSGRTIALFFYDGPISQAVAFERLLRDGDHLADRLLTGFSDRRDGAQLVHIATDGESYGHHHPHGDMALAYALDLLAGREDVRLTNYGEFLENHPPEHEVEIRPDSSWSCVHGIERWRADCGCNSGGRPEWRQTWRLPLRAALDWLRDAVAEGIEQRGRAVFDDPWGARNAYIDVILDRSSPTVERFLARWAPGAASEADRVRSLQMMEMLRNAMLMYTSCGWFFDDLSGIETVQVIQYAGRVLQLAEQSLGLGLEAPFLSLLEKAPSNVPEHRNGRVIYEKRVRPTRVDLASVGAHYAASTFFETYADESLVRLHGFEVERRQARTFQSGSSRLALGAIRVSSVVTWESIDLSYGFLHLGDHNLTGGVRPFRGEAAYASLVEECSQALAAGEVAEVFRALDKHFESLTYTLRSLFRDEQRKAVARILESSTEDIATRYAEIYERYSPLMRFLKGLGFPNPEAFRAAASLVLHKRLRAAIASPDVDPEAIQELLGEIEATGINLDEAGIGYSLARRLEERVASLAGRPDDFALLDSAERSARLIPLFPFSVDLWFVENAYYEMLRSHLEKHRALAEAGDEGARRWVEAFLSLGEILRVRVAG